MTNASSFCYNIFNFKAEGSIMKIILLTAILSIFAQASEKPCRHTNKTGKELIQRIYAAQTFRHEDSNYTANVQELNYNKDGFPNICDISNWQIVIQLTGKHKFLATVTSKLNKKSYSVDQNKKISEK